MSKQKPDLKEMQTSLCGVVIPPSQILPEDSAGGQGKRAIQNSGMCERDQRGLVQEGVVLPANAVEPPAPARVQNAPPPEAAQPAPPPAPNAPGPTQDN